MPTTHFFRVDGADQETGEDTYVVIEADTKPQAERLARERGLLIASVRVAKLTDWEEDPTATPSNGQTDAEPEAAAEQEDIVDFSPATFETAERLEPEAIIEAATEPAPAPAVADRKTAVRSARGGRNGTGIAAAVVLCCVGTALVVGGVLAMTLALWPDAGIRNELQQIDFRLHELSQAVLGGTLVLAGLIAMVLATLCYLFREMGAR